MSTYGDYRDDTLHGLAQLLTEPTARSLTPEDMARVLDCRDSLLISLHRQFRLATGEAGTGSLRLPAVEANPTAALGTVLGDVLRVGPGQAPTDVLVPADPNRWVARWQRPARAALLATDVLDTTHRWRAHPHATWTVVADVADAAAALPMLDTGLAQLARASHDQQLTKLLTRTATSGLGLTAQLTAETARAGRLHDGLARLTRPHPGPAAPRPLRGFADAAAGQQRLAELLHQRRGLLPVKALTPVLIGQARIALEISHAAARLSPSSGRSAWLDTTHAQTAASLTAATRIRAQTLADLMRASRKGVADLLPAGGQPAVWQTSEVLHALQRHPTPTTGAEAVAQLRVLLDVAHRGDTIHKLLTTGIAAAFATGHYLVPHPDSSRLQWRPCLLDVDPPLRAAAETLDSIRRHAPLPDRIVPNQRHQRSLTPIPSASAVLTDAIATRTPDRPASPGMSRGQPLSP